MSNWVFFGAHTNSKGQKIENTLKKMRFTPIRRHVKIKKKARLYDPQFSEYFANRKQKRDEKLYHSYQTSALKLFGMEVY